MEYNGKKALVCGMARSGIAAAKLLNRLGARVTLQDMKKREEISADVLALEGEGIVLYTGANPDEIACAQDLIVLSPGIPCDLPFIAAAENAGIEVISEVELAYRLTPCHEGKSFCKADRRGFLYSEPWGCGLQKNGGQNCGKGVFFQLRRKAAGGHLSGWRCHRGALGRHQRNLDSCG